jgi:hypothetical protein
VDRVPMVFENLGKSLNWKKSTGLDRNRFVQWIVNFLGNNPGKVLEFLLHWPSNVIQLFQ